MPKPTPAPAAPSRLDLRPDHSQDPALDVLLDCLPPWPGSSVPESFTPAPRLRADSAKSPIWPATFPATETPNATIHGVAGNK